MAAVQSRITLYAAGACLLAATAQIHAQTCLKFERANLLPRSGHAMVYDAKRGVTVAFGGSDVSSYSNRTWEWNGTEWTLRATTGPAPRSGHAMAYDSKRGVAVLFGGFPGNFNDETWEWDGKQWSLRATGGPASRAGHAMAYDADSGMVILFGGYSTGLTLPTDTWGWDGAAWHLLAVGGGPSGRLDHAMVYDVARGRTVLLGGRTTGTGDPLLPAELWEWDGTAWTLQNTHWQAQRSGLDAAYDAARGVIVMFGGTSYGYDATTWEYDGSSWTARSTTGPSPRAAHAMTYDSGRGCVVLFGGYQDYTRWGDTWEWNGAQWTRCALGATPPPRTHFGIAYDSQRSVAVMFGGAVPQIASSSPVASSETWEWNGETWDRRSVRGPLPRVAPAMAYDSQRGVTVLFGGSPVPSVSPNAFGDTWEWDGGHWTLRATSGPSPRSHAAMAYDAARGVVVLFGGRSGGPQLYVVHSDIWEWNGTNWSLRIPTSVTNPFTSSAHHAMVYDAAHERVVLNTPSQTWSWNGVDWSSLTCCAPFQMTSRTMAYDPDFDRILTVGGTDNIPPYGALEQLWSWSAGTWRLLADHPTTGRVDAGMAFDEARHEFVLFGGDPNSYSLSGNDTWIIRPCKPGDLSGDDVIDINDLLLLIAGWGECPPQQVCAGDVFPLNGDGVVDVNDLLVVVANWGM